jgi:hypothetical protein
MCNFLCRFHTLWQVPRALLAHNVSLRPGLSHVRASALGASPQTALPWVLTRRSVQNRDWRQARKRTAEGRFADDVDDDPAHAPNAAEAITRAVVRNQRAQQQQQQQQQEGAQRPGANGGLGPLPRSLAGRVTALAGRVTGVRGEAELAPEEGEEMEVPSVHIGSRLAARLTSYPDPSARRNACAQAPRTTRVHNLTSFACITSPSQACPTPAAAVVPVTAIL